MGLDPQSISQKAAELGAALRQRVNAPAVYGQTVVDEETALEQAETQALTALRDKLQAKVGGGASLPTARLATYRPPAGPDYLYPAQGLLALSWLYVLILSTMSISAFEPQVGDVPEVSLTMPINQDGANGSVTADATLTFSVTGGVVSAKLSITGSATATVASSGRVITTAGESTYAFTINPCPDPAGGVSGTVDVTDSETTSSPGRMTLGWKITGHTDYHAQVTDQAEVGSTVTNATWDEQLTRTVSDQPHPSDIALSSSTTFDGSGHVDQSQGGLTIDNLDGTVTGDQARDTTQMMVLFGEITPLMLVQFASEVWKGGKCFEVRPVPKEAQVTPQSQTPVKVTVYHWVDKADVQLPVRATLTGSGKIDPSGQPVTSPATFTYTAAGPGTQGQVTFKVVSRRGIGSADGTYKVNGNLTVDLSGTLKMNAGGIWVYSLQVQGSGIQLTAADDGSISATGQVTVKGTAKATVAPCTATVNEKIGVIARGQLQGPPDAQVWHVQIGPSSENNLGQVAKCPYITVPSNEGDYFGQWTTTLGYVDLPAAGGTITTSGSSSGLLSRQATGTFVAKPR